MATWEGTITTTDATDVWYVGTESMPSSAFSYKMPDVDDVNMKDWFSNTWVKEYECSFKDIPEAVIEKDHLAELKELFEI